MVSVAVVSVAVLQCGSGAVVSVAVVSVAVLQFFTFIIQFCYKISKYKVIGGF